MEFLLVKDYCDYTLLDLYFVQDWSFLDIAN